MNEMYQQGKKTAAGKNPAADYHDSGYDFASLITHILSLLYGSVGGAQLVYERLHVCCGQP
jgi:hypothetical protein